MRECVRVGAPKRLAAIVIAAWGIACGGGSESKPAAAPQVPVESTTVAVAPATARTRVLILGTSLTAGLGLDPDSAYPAVLQRLADSSGYAATIVAAGLSGETSAGALRRVDWLMRDRADLVVIETGANDGLRGLQMDTTRANLVGIIRKVRAANPEARVLLAQMEAPPNLGQSYTRGFHDAFMTVAREEQVTLIPFFLEGIAGVRDLNQDDGIHPNEEGARRAARNMWKALAPLLRDEGGARPR
jgi:acyl-CoA thioesterase-1